MSLGNSQRVYSALLILKEGGSLEQVAERLPNLSRQAAGTPGIGEHAARHIVRSGLRTLMTHVLRGERPEEIPEALWPPAEVREAVQALAPRGMKRSAPARVLRAWIENRAPTAEVQP